MNLVRHHKRGVESKSEVTDDLVVICLVLVLLDKVCRSGKSDLVDILLNFLRCHAKSGIDKLERLFLRIDNDVDILFDTSGIFILSHHLKLL